MLDVKACSIVLRTSWRFQTTDLKAWTMKSEYWCSPCVMQMQGECRYSFLIKFKIQLIQYHQDLSNLSPEITSESFFEFVETQFQSSHKSKQIVCAPLVHVCLKTSNFLFACWLNHFLLRLEQKTFALQKKCDWIVIGSHEILLNLPIGHWTHCNVHSLVDPSHLVNNVHYLFAFFWPFYFFVFTIPSLFSAARYPPHFEAITKGILLK